MKPLEKGTTGKTSNIKNQEAFHTNFVFDELELDMKNKTRSKTSHGENPNKNQEGWCQVCKVLRYDRYDQDMHSRAPLDSTVIYPITRSPKSIRPVK